MDDRKCRHCGHPKVNRPRGLCWRCWHRPEVLVQYPSTSIYARHGVGNGGKGQLPRHPTAAFPGTAAKIEVLHQRAKRGESLFHPDDNGSV